VGILPASSEKPRGHKASTDGHPNPWIDTAVYTFLPGVRSGATPNLSDVVLKSADAMIALPGGEGTALEVVMAYKDYVIPIMEFRARIPYSPSDLVAFCQHVVRIVNRRKLEHVPI